MLGNDFAQKAGMVRQLAALPPDQFVDHLTQVHPHISKAAPNIAPHVFSAATNAVQFLNSKLPGAGNELAGDRPTEPSTAQKNAWLDLHSVVNDPVSVLGHVAKGTLTSHHLQALQSVYPDLHQEMKEKIAEEIGARKMRGESIPYQKKVMLGKFLGAPVDSTMTQPNLMAIMNAAGQNTGPQAQANAQAAAPKRASQAELKEVDKVSSLYQTPSQMRESDRKT